MISAKDIAVDCAAPLPRQSEPIEGRWGDSDRIEHFSPENIEERIQRAILKRLAADNLNQMPEIKIPAALATLTGKTHHNVHR